MSSVAVEPTKPSAPSSARTKPPPSQDAQRPPFRKDIEGLRGIAVLLVVLYHAGVPGFAGGYVGVDVFFVLSGYLITGILATEVVRTGTIDLKRFYARRARRLLPAMAVLLVAVTAFTFVFYAPLEQGPIAETAVATAAYVSNFHFAFGATDYLAADAETNPLLHTWSLSVEEQFYFVWPLLVLLALTLRVPGGRRRKKAPPEISQRRLMWTIAAVCAVSFVLTIYLMGTLRTHWAFFSSPTRAWEFAIGGLGAMVPRLTRDAEGWRFGSLDEVPPVAHVFGWIGLAGVLVAGCFYSARTPFPGYAALLPAVGTVMALRAGTAEASADSDALLAKALSWWPLQELGRLSYSWYLWHWPVLVFAAGTLGHLPLLQRIAFAAGSLVLAEASYRLVENPVRHHRFLAERSGRGLALAATLTAFGVSLALGWGYVADEASRAPDQQTYAAAASDRLRGCKTDMGGSEITECVFGDSTSTTTAILFGDSHADHWLPALIPIAEEEEWRLITLTKSGCALIDETEWNRQLNRPYWECDAWKEAAFARIEALEPELVFATFSVANAFTDEQWMGGTTRAYRRLLDYAQRVIHIRDVPRPGFEVPACLSRVAWRGSDGECSFDPTAHAFSRVNDLVEEAVQASGDVDIVDLSAVICPGERCDVERDGMVLYQDRHHITATFAASLAPALAEAINEVMGDGPLRGTPVTDRGTSKEAGAES